MAIKLTKVKAVPKEVPAKVDSASSALLKKPAQPQEVTAVMPELKSQPKAEPVTQTEILDMSKVNLLDLQTLDEAILVDTFGRLHDEIQAIPVDPRVNQLALVQTEIRRRITALDAKPQMSLKFGGKHWLLDISACSKNSRALLPDAARKVHEMLGDSGFYPLVKLNLSDLDKYLTPDQVALVVTSDTGFSSNRKITPIYLGDV